MGRQRDLLAGMRCPGRFRSRNNARIDCFTLDNHRRARHRKSDRRADEQKKAGEPKRPVVAPGGGDHLSSGDRRDHAEHVPSNNQVERRGRCDASQRDGEDDQKHRKVRREGHGEDGRTGQHWERNRVAAATRAHAALLQIVVAETPDENTPTGRVIETGGPVCIVLKTNEE